MISGRQIEKPFEWMKTIRGTAQDPSCGHGPVAWFLARLQLLASPSSWRHVFQQPARKALLHYRRLDARRRDAPAS